MGVGTGCMLLPRRDDTAAKAASDGIAGNPGTMTGTETGTGRERGSDAGTEGMEVDCGGSTEAAAAAPTPVADERRSKPSRPRMARKLSMASAAARVVASKADDRSEEPVMDRRDAN